MTAGDLHRILLTFPDKGWIMKELFVTYLGQLFRIVKPSETVWFLLLWAIIRLRLP